MIKIDNTSKFLVLFSTMLSCSKSLVYDHSQNMISGDNQNVVPDYSENTTSCYTHRNSSCYHCCLKSVNYCQFAHFYNRFDLLWVYNQNTKPLSPEVRRVIIKKILPGVSKKINQNITKDKNYKIACKALLKIRNKGSRIILERIIRKYKQSFFEDFYEGLIDFCVGAYNEIAYPSFKKNKLQSTAIITGFIIELKFDKSIPVDLLNIIYKYLAYPNRSIHMLRFRDVRIVAQLSHSIYNYAPIVCKWQKKRWLHKLSEREEKAVLNNQPDNVYQKLIDKPKFSLSLWEFTYPITYDFLVNGFIRSYGNVSDKIKMKIYNFFCLDVKNDWCRIIPTTINCSCKLYSIDSKNEYIIYISDYDPTKNINWLTFTHSGYGGHNAFLYNVVAFELFKREYPYIKNPFINKYHQGKYLTLDNNLYSEKIVSKYAIEELWGYKLAAILLLEGILIETSNVNYYDFKYKKYQEIKNNIKNQKIEDLYFSEDDKNYDEYNRPIDVDTLAKALTKSLLLNV